MPTLVHKQALSQAYKGRRRRKPTAESADERQAKPENRIGQYLQGPSQSWSAAAIKRLAGSAGIIFSFCYVLEKILCKTMATCTVIADELMKPGDGVAGAY
jgi:hypothetical protein